MCIWFWWESQKKKETTKKIQARWVYNIEIDLREMGW
jgi:hypothetical protein